MKKDALINMWLDCLAIANDVHVFILKTWEDTKHALRVWLGPGARNWYLTSDSQITHISVPGSLVFCPLQNRICQESQLNSDERGKRLPWLSVTVQKNEDTWDLTDWISDIRILSDCPVPSLVQLIRLASRVHHVYVYESEVTQVHVTNRDGETEMYQFQGTVKLEKIN